MSRTVSLTSRVRMPDGILLQLLQDELILLNLSNGTYYSLDPIGTRIWQLLQTAPAQPLRSIRDTLLEEYKTSAERCAHDLFALVTQLQEHRLLEVVD